MRDGDIYLWAWKDDAAQDRFSCHAKSMIAVVKDGQLIDTFWASGDGYVVDPAMVHLTFRGNTSDLREISAHEAHYYDENTVVDMRHSNNSLGPVYVPMDATRSSSAMLAYLGRLHDDAQAEISAAKRRLDMIKSAEDKVRAGQLDDVYV